MRPVSNDFPVLPRQMPSIILSVYPLAPQLPDGNGRSGGCVLLSLLCSFLPYCMQEYSKGWASAATGTEVSAERWFT